jgi:hypothetical protein
MPRQTGPKRTPRQRERDLELIASWVLEGLGLFNVTARLNTLRGPDGYTLSFQQVAQDIRLLERRWRDQATAQIEEARSQQAAKLRLVWATMWAEWEDSKTVKETTSSERVTAGLPREDGKPGFTRDRASIRKEQRQGDPRYIKLALAALIQEIKLLGTGSLEEQQVATMRREAERIGRELDLPAADVLADAQRILRGELVWPPLR